MAQSQLFLGRLEPIYGWHIQVMPNARTAETSTTNRQKN